MYDTMYNFIFHTLYSFHEGIYIETDDTGNLARLYLGKVLCLAIHASVT